MKKIDEIRRDFWSYYLQHDPDANAKYYHDSNYWVALSTTDKVIISLGIEQNGSSIFLRRPAGSKGDSAKLFLEPISRTLTKRLLVPFEAEGEIDEGRYFRKRTKAAFTLRSQWPEIARWFRASRTRYSEMIDMALNDPLD